jgi:hypothetical protein
MALPKIDVPVFNLTLPFSEKKIKYRPFTVKEEKILLFGQQSKDLTHIAESVKQVVQNCVLNDVIITDLPSFEVDFLFLKLRSVSVQNIVSLKIKDEDDEQYYDVEVDLEEVGLVSDNTHDGSFRLNDTYSVKLRYPSFNNVETITASQQGETNLGKVTFDLIGETIESVYNDDGTDVYFLKDYTKEERDEFLESLTSKNFQDIQQFLGAAPQIRHTIEYTKEDGTVIERELKGLFDFFTFA